jgi:hypothetical protein
MASTPSITVHMVTEAHIKVITYVGSVGYLYASFLAIWSKIMFLIIFRYWQKIPDPFLGPKDVRGLLVLRGVAGYRVLCDLSNVSISQSKSFSASLVFPGYISPSNTYPCLMRLC